MARHPLEVPIDKLRRAIDLGELDFDSTEEIPPLDGTIGQPRAVSAIEFGLQIDNDGFNMYVSGSSGTGRTTTLTSYLAKMARTKSVPSDWCYVFNFADPYRPLAISLPTGRGSDLDKDMSEFVEGAKRDIPRAFESENYEERRGEIVKEIQDARDTTVRDLEAEAARDGFVIQPTLLGYALVPVYEGKNLSQTEFDALPEEVKRVYHGKSAELQGEVREALAKLRRLEKDLHERVRALDREVALFAVGHLLDDLRNKYREFPKISEYLGHVQEDVIEHHEDFRSTAEGEAVTIPGLGKIGRGDVTERYKVNVFVRNDHLEGAPVIVEQNPTYYNLFGRIDYRAHMGTIVTDFSMIRAGAIHRANGGYLVLQARDVLTSILSWDYLKRTLRAKEARIENIGEQYSAFPTATLKPEPIHIDIKVIMVGDPNIYYLLYFLDEDFRKLFKVRSDFDSEMKRSPENLRGYAAFISRKVQESGLRHFHKSAVAAIAEYGSRLLEHQNRLSTRFIDIADLAVEANFWAGKDNSPLVKAEHVERAVAEKEYRSNLIEEKIEEMIDEGTILIDTAKAVPGQLNGISIISMGDYYFGRPNRITAKAAVGSAGLVSVDRETKLGGRIFGKGFLILKGYLSGQYALDKPLALSASVTFEQTYDEVEGDSASCAELYAILSSLSRLPLSQGLAVTGSVNQHGEVQAIGGVTRKVEGFFEVCKAQGLTGNQGAIIPESNVKNLMLKKEVLDAVRDGKFHIYAVKTVDEGIELLTGVTAGARQANGSFPKGTVHFLVDKRLREFADKLKEYGRPPTRRGEQDDEEKLAA
ncbi:MAG: AAA family ATPase [Chloroflexi bacterium]|nr:AAA family ATPase [Chloroflexota bacterium]